MTMGISYGAGDGGEVAHDGVGVQLGRTGRADHDGIGAGLAREPGVIDAGAHAVGGRAGDYAHAPIHVADHGLQHAHAFAVVHARHFAGDAERGEAVDSRADEEIDHALEAFEIQVAGRGKGRGQDGVYAFQLQMIPPKKIYGYSVTLSCLCHRMLSSAGRSLPPMTN